MESTSGAPAAAGTEGEQPADPAASRVFPGGGEMARLCRGFDWSSTALGPVSGWSRALCTTVGIVLSSRNPMFLWWGPELVQIYNDAYRPSLGHAGRHPQALGARCEEFWTDIWTAIGPQIRQVMTTGEATWYEDQYLPIMRNGRLEDVWWTYSYSPVREEDGSIAGTLVVCQETTNRIQTAAALRDSEARYRTLFESLDEGFCVIEVIFDAAGAAVDYRFVEINPAFAGQTGLVDPMGRTARELLPDLEAHWFETYGRVARTGVPIRFQSGSDVMGRWFDVYAFRVGPADDHRVALLFKDVSAARAAVAEREQLLRALEVERARLAHVFQQAPTFLAVLRGPEHVFELANAAYYQLIGDREVIGKAVHEALPEVRGQGFMDLLDGVLATGTPYVGREMPVTLARGAEGHSEVRFVDFIFLPLVEADGARSGVIAHGTDVTAHVHARREIEQLYTREQQARAAVEHAYGLAEAANRAKGEFLAIMSHELRTPLNAIGGYAELLEMGIRGPVSPQQREDLRRIQVSQRHLLGLINEVLNYAKLETGTVHYDLASVPVRETLVTAESLIAPQARAKGLTLTMHECSRELVARADPEKLRQILLNLLSNAVKFTDRGGRIDIVCHQDDVQMTIAVSDTGIGIPVDKIDEIFDPFVQVRADLTRPNEGTGLGLAISRDLARGMGGDLIVESTLGSGSTFTLTLPRG